MAFLNEFRSEGMVSKKKLDERVVLKNPAKIDDDLPQSDVNISGHSNSESPLTDFKKTESGEEEDLNNGEDLNSEEAAEEEGEDAPAPQANGKKTPGAMLLDVALASITAASSVIKMICSHAQSGDSELPTEVVQGLFGFDMALQGYMRNLADWTGAQMPAPDMAGSAQADDQDGDSFEGEEDGEDFNAQTDEGEGELDQDPLRDGGQPYDKQTIDQTDNRGDNDSSMDPDQDGDDDSSEEGDDDDDFFSADDESDDDSSSDDDSDEESEDDGEDDGDDDKKKKPNPFAK